MSLSKKSMFATLITTVLVVVIALGALFGYRAYINSKVEKGFKQITVKVIIDTEDEIYENTHKFWTEEDFLGNALIDEGIVGVNESQYGRYIISVDGKEADENKQEFWQIKHNGEDALVGIDDLAIKHEDTIVLEKLTW